MAETRISVCDGKYTLIHDNGRDFRCLRYGEPWRDLIGDKMVLSLVYEIEELRKVGEVVVTTNPRGACVAVTRQDEEHRILSVIWERKPINWEAERKRFEKAAYAHYLRRHADRKTTDCDEPVGTPEQLFWRQPNGEYGVQMFNASWWAWQEALK